VGKVKGCTEHKCKEKGWLDKGQTTRYFRYYSGYRIRQDLFCLVQLQNRTLKKAFQAPQLLKPQVPPKSICTRMTGNKGTPD